MPIDQHTPPDAANDPDDGTMGEGSGRSMTLEEFRNGGKPMTTLERVELAARTLPLGSKGHIAAARLLLAKTMPDLKAVEVSGEVNHRHTTAEALEQARQRAIKRAESTQH